MTFVCICFIIAFHHCFSSLLSISYISLSALCAACAGGFVQIECSQRPHLGTLQRRTSGSYLGGCGHQCTAAGARKAAKRKGHWLKLLWLLLDDGESGCLAGELPYLRSVESNIEDLYIILYN